MEWNDETIGRLRALWTEGLSTAEIGRRLGVSKNAVVGKAHRLNLSARPSPIRRDGLANGEPRPAAARRVTGSTLPPLNDAAPVVVGQAAPATPDQAPVRVLPAPVRAPVAVAPAPRPIVSRPIAVRSTPFRSTRTSACCWPIGEPGTKSFRFCSGDAVTGKPYCQEHIQLAYVKVRDRREEAAA
jgi:GcrA cell cycle regulator